MSTIIEILTAAALILSIIIPGGAFLLGERNKKRYKKALAVNCFFFFGTLLVGTIAMFAGAQNVQAATDAAGSGKWWKIFYTLHELRTAECSSISR